MHGCDYGETGIGGWGTTEREIATVMEQVRRRWPPPTDLRRRVRPLYEDDPRLGVRIVQENQ